MAVINVFKRRKAIIYLNRIEVNRRRDLIKQWFENDVIFKEAYNEKLYSALSTTLKDIFRFPPLDEAVKPTRKDMGLDIVIQKYQTGAAGEISINVSPYFIGIPLFWRPKIVLVARLYNLKSGKTKKIITIREKLEMKFVLRRIFSLEATLPWKHTYPVELMEGLLYRAGCRLLSKLQKYQ